MLFRVSPGADAARASATTTQMANWCGIPNCAVSLTHWRSRRPTATYGYARDERGRKQYIYHPRWMELRERDKFEHLLEFAASLPRIRRRVGRDLGLAGLPREKVLAAVVRLLETTLARVGNSSYARENNSYGLTTIRKKHVELDDDTVAFEFAGKGGQEWHVETDDPRVMEVVRTCVEIPGYELFKYLGEDGNRYDVHSGHVNSYLKEITGRDVTAKDFRTWAATVLCAQELEGAQDRKRVV